MIANQTLKHTRNIASDGLGCVGRDRLVIGVCSEVILPQRNHSAVADVEVISSLIHFAGKGGHLLVLPSPIAVGARLGGLSMKDSGMTNDQAKSLYHTGYEFLRENFLERSKMMGFLSPEMETINSKAESNDFSISLRQNIHQQNINARRPGSVEKFMAVVLGEGAKGAVRTQESFNETFVMTDIAKTIRAAGVITLAKTKQVKRFKRIANEGDLAPQSLLRKRQRLLNLSRILGEAGVELWYATPLPGVLRDILAMRADGLSNQAVNLSVFEKQLG